ncbi:MAG: SLC13 family permease, partial [Planctomycetota bacterium]
RGEKSLVAEPDLVLRSGDVLTFVGDLESVVDLQQVRGLEPLREERSSYRADRRLIEAVVSNSSRFVGQTIRDSQLRTRYGAVVLGVHRLGHRLEGKIGDIVLRPGDTLLLEAGDEFNGRHLDSRDFLLVTERGGPAPRHERAWVASAILVLLVATITAGLLSPLAAAMVAAGGMILTRCCTGPQARTALDLQVLVTIAAAFGIGHAVETTQLAAQAAGVVTGLAESLGIYGLLGAVYVLTVLCSMTMTNNAAAVLMFPIALVVAGQAGLPVLPFAVAIAVAASCEFTTPIGYQTNLMVMGPGGYRWLDYAKFGGPLTVLCGAICVGLAPLFYG